MIAAIFTLFVFIVVILLIVTEKLNRAVASISGAIIAFVFLLIFPQDIFQAISSFSLSDLKDVNNLIILSLKLTPEQHVFFILLENNIFEPFHTSEVITFMFGTEAENYSNLHSIILVLGIMIQVHICQDAGVFQFLALKLIKGAKGNPQTLLLLCGLLAVFVSAILDVILAIIILIPLTIMICRMLNINPIPYILSEAILVNIGGIIFLISSIPNILISQAAGFTFIDYLINTAWFSIILTVVTLFIFKNYFKNQLELPKRRLVRVLEEFDPWSFVQDKQLFYKSIVFLGATIILIVLLPDYPDTVAISLSFTLIIFSKLKGEQVIESVDFELMLYLIGIFILTGCMKYAGVMTSIGVVLKDITGDNPLVTTQLILWLSAFLSSGMDNIPITSALLPTMPIITLGFNTSNTHLSYYALGFGCNLGEALAPIGGNLIVIKISEQNNVNLKFKDFLKIGFISALIQLAITSLYLGIRLGMG